MSEFKSRTALLFRGRRRELDLNCREAAERAGYGNIAKGMRRMQRLESEGNYFPHPEIWPRFADGLDIDEERIREAMRENFRELDRPIEPYIVLRLMATVYKRVDLPEDCTLEEAKEKARRMVERTGLPCCVVLSAVRALYFEPDGSCEEKYSVPAGGLGSRGDDLEFMRSVDRYCEKEREGKDE